MSATSRAPEPNDKGDEERRRDSDQVALGKLVHVLGRVCPNLDNRDGPVAEGDGE